MTYLIAGSILAIVLSAVFLILGWVGANETLIYLSIAASVAAAVCLALAYSRSRGAAPPLVAPPAEEDPPAKG